MKLSLRSRFGAIFSSLILSMSMFAPARADVVLAWNEALTQFLATRGDEIPIHVQARAYAMLHLAVEQAMVAAEAPVRPIGAPDDERQAAATCAARDVLVGILPGGAAGFEALARTQLHVLADTAAASARATARGRHVATTVLRKREADHWVDMDSRRAALAALSEPLTSNHAASLRAPPSPWLAATPFVLKTAAQFQSTAPYWTDLDGKLQLNAGLARAKLFDAVDRAASADTLVNFWCESPVVTWNRIACAVVDRAGLDLATRARILAVVNLAIADASLSSLHSRYVLNTWKSHRTEGWVAVTGTPLATDVVAHLDGGDRTVMVRSEALQALIPPVPNFPSTSATVAGAAGTVLTALCPSQPPSVELRGGPADGSRDALASFGRSYASVGAAAVECAYVSSLDGRHSRASCVAGYRLGESIGNYITKQARAQKR